jgi:hypothetical protein
VNSIQNLEQGEGLCVRLKGQGLIYNLNSKSKGLNERIWRILDRVFIWEKWRGLCAKFWQKQLLAKLFS